MNTLLKIDPKISHLIDQESMRQVDELEMIPSENYVSHAVLQAVGSVLMNKYSEGQAFKRYYQGNQNIDQIEDLTKKRALRAFGLQKETWGVCVQAVTGSVANMAVYVGLLEPGDKMMGMFLYDGGHLSHGWQLPDGKKVSFTSKIFKPTYYYVDQSTGQFNYDNVEEIALREKPKIIISGGTAYPREIDHKRMAQIAKKANAFYMADIAHEAGLVLAGVNSSPFPYADVVTMTTRKTLRGPIGALIFAKHDLIKQIVRAVFPGLQGGPQNHSIAGIGVALHEAMKPEFKIYASQIIKNAQRLAKIFMQNNITVVSGGTDKHLVLLDLRNLNTFGNIAAIALEQAGIITNYNTMPGNTNPPMYPSGLRMGTPAITSRGMKEKEMDLIGNWIVNILKHVKDHTLPDDKTQRSAYIKSWQLEAQKDPFYKAIKTQVQALTKKFPVPGISI